MKVWINGCFDILHFGHFRLIEFARLLKGKEGKLVIGIDSDTRVKELKGENRPHTNESYRLFNLTQIKGVDEVVIFNSEKDLEETIKEYSPDLFVIGDEYKNKKIVGGKYAKEIVYYPKVDGFSTTKILENE